MYQVDDLGIKNDGDTVVFRTVVGVRLRKERQHGVD